jgi:regulatory protein
VGDLLGKTDGLTETDNAFEKGLTFLERRDRTVAEVRERLAKLRFEKDVADAAIAKLEELGYLNDAVFARRYLRMLIGKGHGRLRVVQEMRNKGFAGELARQTIDELYSDEAEEEAARAVADRRRREIPAALWEQEPQKAEEKVIRRLVSRGFPYAVVRKVTEGMRHV